MIELKNAQVGYGKKTVLGDVSFIAEQGKITVILGKNGCGKSTLLKTIAGNLPYTGSILLNGNEISAMKVSDRAKYLAVMPQMMHAPGVTVREFVAYGRQPYTGSFGILSKKDYEIVDEVMKKADIVGISHRMVNRISGGERQRAYFAMLLAQCTDNVLLDEPGAHLDAHHNRLLTDFMKELAGEGKTVVTVMHDINCAIETADKIIFVDSGKVIFDGSAGDFSMSNIPKEILGLRSVSCVDDGKECILFR